MGVRVHRYFAWSVLISFFFVQGLVWAGSFTFTVPAARQPVAREYIARFESHITVHANASMTVQETIQVVSAGVQIVRGITRDFPTRYKTKLGFIYKTGFTVTNVLYDGEPVPFRLVDWANGKRLYIGDPNTYVKPGQHTYTISYTTDRQLGFFQDHDELYWNVTGNDVVFPIEYACAYVTLPSAVPTQKITPHGYTGYYGQQGTNYRAQVTAQGKTFFETTKPLAPHEGLTIVVSWPKGFVHAPSTAQKIWYFLRDNIMVALLLLGLIILIGYYYFVFRFIRKQTQYGTVIPLFYPPADMLPGAIRYIMNMGYDAKLLAADVVNMAVKGLITISHESSFFGRSTYTLVKHTGREADVPKLYTQLYTILFASGEKVPLTSARYNIKIMQQASEKLANYYYNLFGNEYFKSGIEYAVAGIFISGFFGLLLPPLLPIAILTEWWIAAIILFIIINAICIYKLPHYTQKGQKLKEDIEGFKLFLATTETERLKIIGSPPTKTPELYETYLPYAMALGVEEQWNRQFASVFERLAQAGTPYTPVWYHGRTPFTHIPTSQFSNSFSRAISNTSTISSSSTPPGTSSGSRGSGSSGGGGGGGGVGGW